MSKQIYGLTITTTNENEVDSYSAFHEKCATTILSLREEAARIGLDRAELVLSTAAAEMFVIKATSIMGTQFRNLKNGEIC